jgi:hypothetical protein
MKYLQGVFFAILIFLSFLPYNLFFDNNFNALPAQVIIIFLLSRFFFSVHFHDILLITLSFCILTLNSNIQFDNLFSSSITATFVIIWFILISKNMRFGIKYLYKIITILLLIMIVFTCYYNVDFFLTSDLTARLRGFGSGTIYSVISLYGFTYIILRYKKKMILKTIFYPTLVIFFFTAILTQSRGVLLTMIFVFLVTEIKNFKFSHALLTIFLGIYFIIDSAVLERFYYDDSSDINHLSSGRLNTQTYIIESLFSSDNMTIFLGNGLNSIKQNLQPLGFEFPHLDILFVIYEGGIVLLFIYLIFIYKVYKMYQNKVLFFVFLISSLHTNMIISPGFLFLGFLMDKSLPFKTDNNTIKIE